MKKCTFIPLITISQNFVMKFHKKNLIGWTLRIIVIIKKFQLPLENYDNSFNISFFLPFRFTFIYCNLDESGKLFSTAVYPVANKKISQNPSNFCLCRCVLCNNSGRKLIDSHSFSHLLIVFFQNFWLVL